MAPTTPVKPFSIDDTNASDSDEALVTARSSPAPQPFASTSSYRDTDTAFSPSEPSLVVFDSGLPSEPSPSLSSKRDSAEYYPPRPVKSGLASREAEFDLDDGELDEEDEEGPLMEGLLQTGRARKSVEMGRRESRVKDLEADDDPPEWIHRGAGVLAGIANMSNSILGAGIIGLPYALREAGFFAGLILLVVLGCVTDWTIRLIVLNAKMSGRTTYIDIMDRCFGKPGRAAVSFFQFAFAFGGMCAFCVILGDTIPHVLASVLPAEHGGFVSFLISRPFVITFLTLGVSFPLSLYRDIEKLSKASALALVSMVVIVVSVAVHGPGVDIELKGDLTQRWTFIQSGFFEAIGVISFAFVCHHNSLLIYGSLRTPTLDRFAQVTHVSTTISVFACLCMSTSGFLVFTNRTQGNILNNFSDDDTLINIARACFGANMFTTLPLEAFVCREVMETYFWPGEDFNKRRHLIITTALVFSALIVSLATCDLGLILELAGGFSATALAYIFPAGCFLVLSDGGAKQQMTRIAAWLCAAFGIAVMGLSTVLSITKALRGDAHKVCAA